MQYIQNFANLAEFVKNPQNTLNFFLSLPKGFMSKKSSTTQRAKSINIYSPFFHKVSRSFWDRIEKLCDHIIRAPSHECLLGLLPYVLLRVDATFLLIDMVLCQCSEILDNFKVRIVRRPLKHRGPRENASCTWNCGRVHSTVRGASDRGRSHRKASMRGFHSIFHNARYHPPKQVL
jgi:hypothetical protein